MLRDGIDVLYVWRKEEGRGCVSIKDCIDTLEKRLRDNIRKNEERLITAASNSIVGQREKQQKLGNRNGKKNNRMNISSDKTAHEKSLTWLRKRNLKRKTESLLIAAQKNAIRTNRIKAKIDNTEQNSKYILCCEKDETVNPIIIECSQLIQKGYKTRHDWVAMVIRWELCKELKFDHTSKCYMHILESVLENESHKIHSNQSRPKDKTQWILPCRQTSE